jgi:ubiquitin C-terminal hydrolase
MGPHEPTVLSEENKNAYECTVCASKQKALKSSRLHYLPPTLILCLQRFKSGQKNQTLVEFPLHGLDLTD